MNGSLGPNAQAILLLTAPLIAGRQPRSAKPLSANTYGKLARHLGEMGHEPADLLDPGMLAELAQVSGAPDLERLQHLVGRGFLLAQALERWAARAIWVVTRADPDYPRRLKRRLRGNAPPVLYGCGDRSRMDEGGLAVVGSRQVNKTLVQYTEGVGRLAARTGVTIVSGGARGIDQAAMRGALEAGGRSLGILANGLERAALNRGNRPALMDGRLLLVSPYDPSVRFLVWHAMERNKLIYALSDAALVVNSDLGRGGTWGGATEQLEKLYFVPVYVRAGGERSDGLEGLLARGAEAWPTPESREDMQAVLRRGGSRSRKPAEFAQQELFGPGTEAAGTEPLVRERTPAEAAANADGTVKAARRLLPAMSEEMTRQEILTALELRHLGNLRTRYLEPCLREGWIEMTLPEKPPDRKQRFRLTAEGCRFVEDL